MWARNSGLALLIVGLGAVLPISSFSQDGLVETQFHRVFLKNGNVIDGHITKQSPLSVTLRLLKVGEMTIRVDTIDRIEFLKIRSIQEAPRRENLRPPTVDPKVGSSVPPTPVNPKPELPTSQTPSGRATKPRQPQELYQPTPEIRAKADEILRAVEAADLEGRDQIALKLREVGGDVAPYLASLLEQTSRDMSMQILQVLFKMKDFKAMPVVLQLLNSPLPAIRAQSGALLGEIQGAGSLQAAGSLSKDEDPAVRQIYVALVQRFGTEDSIDALGPLLSDPDRDVRSRSQAVLQDLGQRFNRTDRVSTALQRALESTTPRIRPEILGMIGKSHVSESWRLVSPYLSDEDAATRKAATGALVLLGAPECGNSLLAQIAQEKDDTVRPALAEAAQRLKIVSAIPYLIDWLDGTPVEVRSNSLKSLQILSGTVLGPDRQAWGEWWKKNSPK